MGAGRGPGRRRNLGSGRGLHQRRRLVFGITQTVTLGRLEQCLHPNGPPANRPCWTGRPAAGGRYQPHRPPARRNFATVGLVILHGRGRPSIATAAPCAGRMQRRVVSVYTDPLIVNNVITITSGPTTPLALAGESPFSMPAPRSSAAISFTATSPTCGTGLGGGIAEHSNWHHQGIISGATTTCRARLGAGIMALFQPRQHHRQRHRENVSSFARRQS